MNAGPAIGFVGLGTMGRPMAYRLLAAGFGLTVYDVNPAAADALCGKGAVRAGGLEDLGAGSDVFIHRQVSQKEFNFRSTHGVGVTHMVEVNEANDPANVARLGLR